MRSIKSLESWDEMTRNRKVFVSVFSPMEGLD